MSGTGGAIYPPAPYAPLTAGLDARAQEIPERRRNSDIRRRRGWLMRRMLLAADIFGLTAAFVLIHIGLAWLNGDTLPEAKSYLVFAATLPGWIVLAKLDGLYDRDGERADHTTV